MKKIALITLFTSCLVPWLASAQTFTVTGSDHGSYTPVSGTSNYYVICQDDNLTLNFSPGGGACPSGTLTYQWFFNGTSMGAAAASANKSISAFDVAEVGSYRLDVICDISGTITTTQHSILLGFSADPLPSITKAEDICGPVSTSTLFSGSSSTFTGNCGTCDAALGFQWTFKNGTDTETLGTTANSFSTDYATLLGPPLNVTGATSSLVLELVATDIWGCEWTATPATVDINREPFTAFTVTPDPMVIGTTGSPINLTSMLSGGAGTSGYALSYSGATSGAISGSNYHLINPGAENITVSATKDICTYQLSDPFTVNSSVAISFANLTRAAASGTWEACVGDIIEFTYTGAITAPGFVRFAKQGGGFVVVELASCAAPCSTLPTGTPTASTLANYTTAGNMGGIDATAKKIRLAVPAGTTTGNVSFYAVHPGTTAVATSVASLTDPANLTINNPPVGFAIVKNPMCYSDRATLVGIPAGGIFSAEEAEIDMTTGVAATYTAAGSFTPNSDLIDVTGTDPVLDGSKITVSSSINDGGQMVRLTYTYTPKYTDGTACPTNITDQETIPIYDNRSVNFSFPLVTYDPGATPFNLNTGISTITPAPNGGATLPSSPPGANNWIDAPNAFDFWGTFVQEGVVPVSNPHFNFLTAQAGVGTYTVNLEMDNNGCAIESEGEINTLPAPEFVNLPTALCKTVGSITFQRDPNYRFRHVRDTFINCTPIFITVPIGGGPSVGALRPSLDSTITLAPQNNSFFDSKGGTSLSQFSITEGDEALFSGMEAMQLRPLGYTCEPVAVTEEDLFKFSILNIYNGSPGGTLIASLNSSLVAAPIASAGAISITNMNTVSEQFTIDFSHSVFSSISTNIYVELVLSNSGTSQPVTSYSGSSAPYTNLVLGSSVTLPYTETEIVQQVQLVSTGDITIDNFPGVVCYNEPTFAITSTPPYEPGFSSFTVENVVSGHQSSLVENNFDVTTFFDNGTTDSLYNLIYTFTKYFGCDTIDTVSFIVKAPQPVTFVGSSIGTGSHLCINSVEELWYASPPPTAGAGGVFSGPGIGVTNQGTAASVNNIFAPKVAGINTTTGHEITYTFTDLFGCVSEASRTIYVRNTPAVELTSTEPDNVYCSDVANAVLTGFPDTSAVGGTASYFGPTIVGDNIFHPALVYLLDSAAAGGGVEVYYSYTDTFGCKGTDTLVLAVQPLPILQINNIAPRYCENAPLVTNMTGTDLTGILAASASFYGNGVINSGNGNFSYSPSQAGSGPDTIFYTRTNQYGCADTTFKTVTIDTVPRPDILNLDADYCVNEPVFTLQGTPNSAALPSTSSSFTGIGVLQAGGIYTFNPQLAASQAGFGNRVITYTFTDSRGCTGIDRDTTIIRELPTGNFSLDPAYCVDAPDEFLQPTIIGGPFLSASFSGSGIVDPIAGQLNFDSAAVSGYGLKPIVFTYADSFGCSNTTTDYYILNPLPTANIAGLSPGYCTNNSTITFQGFPAGTLGVASSFIHNFGASYAVTNANLAQASINPATVAPGPYTISYAYMDNNGCRDTATQSVEIFAPPAPNITNLAPQYCEVQDTFFLIALPLGGHFAGAGTQQDTNFFMPFRSGPGTHIISYTVSQANPLTVSAGSVTCTAVDMDTTTVYALPIPSIAAPSNNAQFCETDAPMTIQGTIANVTQWVEELSTYSGTGVGYTLVPTIVNIPPWGNVTIMDTVYHFDPALAGPGTHFVTFSATNIFGCVDSVTNSYVVFPSLNPSFAVPPTFCESDAIYPLAGSPSPGTFYRNGTTVTFFDPNPNYPATPLTATQVDTIVYEVSNAQCTNRDTQLVTIYPVPVISYVGLNGLDTIYRACIGQDTLVLQPNIVGGVFSGSGVLFGTNIFLPTIAGVGEHAVSYQYTDTTTSCSNIYTDTFYTYNTPHVVLQSVGNCGDEQVVFSVDTAQLNVFGMFQGSLYDVVNTVQWNMGDGTIRNESASPGNIVDTVEHSYAAAGAYYVSLYVENNGFCSDSDTIRIIVSPKETPTSNDPYFEDFELSNGGWLEESEAGAFSSLLWEWGLADGSRISTINDADHLNVWITHKDGAYGLDESGWVYSPCFDLTELQRPMIALDYFSDTDLGNDGTVIEFYHEGLQAWKPLGNVGRGIHWYNKDVIAGRPGLQDLAPFGWSGEEDDWKNARFPLDEFINYENFRFRIAFGAVGVHNRGLEGFAFDNVWIGERTRNVLVEHFANVQFPTMAAINDHVYHLVFATPAIKDVVLLQYQTDYLFDEFNADNAADANTRELYYGASVPAKAIIDGQLNQASGLLSLNDLEKEMLETPKFNISIEDFEIDQATQQLSAHIELTALADLPLAQYVLQVVVIEDSLQYTQTLIPTEVNSIMRAMLPDGAAGTQYEQTWASGDVVPMDVNWTYTAAKHKPQDLEMIVFVQNYSTKEVYQAAWTRDITIFLDALPADQVEQAQDDAAILQALQLYPNPTSDQFTVSFDQVIGEGYDWRVVDMRGVVLAEGRADAGTTQFSVSTFDWASGMYVLVMGNERVVHHRKVVVAR